MTAIITRGDAANLQLPDESVDLIITSPPYFALRSYQDGGEHYTGQVGDEPTPAEYVDALLTCTAEWMRVLKPGGSIFVNLGDKYAGNNNGTSGHRAQSRTPGTARRGLTTGAPVKSLLGLPWRYAIRCVDDLGLILRSEIVWAKPNGLPESVTDRVRRSHEQLFHFTKEPRYYSAVDAIREAHVMKPQRRSGRPVDETPRQGQPRQAWSTSSRDEPGVDGHPLGKLPGSVWTIATAPLKVPTWRGVEAGRIVRYFAGAAAKARADAEAWQRAGGAARRSIRPMADHFAAYPPELVRRVVLGWSPRSVCTACGEGRRPVVASVGLDLSRPQAKRAHELAEAGGLTEAHKQALLSVGVSDTGRGAATQSGTGKNTAEVYALAAEARRVLGGYAREYLLRRPTSFGEACACPDTSAPARPGVVLDPFGGTGTTALVASVHGRVGVTNDLSDDYGRIARWRTTDEGQQAKAAGTKARPVARRTKPVVVPVAREVAAQIALFGDEDEAA